MNIPSISTPSDRPVTLFDFLTVLAAGLLILGVVALLTPVFFVPREEAHSITETIPAGELLSAELWLSAETTGDHTYLRLNDPSHPPKRYTTDDINNIVVPLFEGRHRVVVDSWKSGGVLDPKDVRPVIRGIFLEHRPLRPDK